MNALQVALFAVLAVAAFAQFDGADFSAYGQAVGADSPQFDSSSFGGEGGQLDGQQISAQDFQNFQGYQQQGPQQAGGQFDASSFAAQYGGDADSAAQYQ